MSGVSVYADRVEAGRRLAKQLRRYQGQGTVVLGIPRGGVVVAAEVAKALDATLDIIIPRKIGAPGNPELAIGAVAGPGEVILHKDLVRSLRVSVSYLKEEVRRQLAEIERRRHRYLKDRPSVELDGKTVIIVDDGLATGSTAEAAVASVRRRCPAKTVLAVPVAPRDACKRLEGQVDELVCGVTPAHFYAVGQFYADFAQTTDDEVIGLLEEAG